MKARLLDACVGLLLLAFAVLKVEGGEFSLLVAIVTAIEAILGLSLLVGRSPRASAMGTLLLGVAFCVFSAIDATRPAAPACGCLGRVRLSFVDHVLLSAVVLACGSLEVLTLPNRMRPNVGQPAPGAG